MNACFPHSPRWCYQPFGQALREGAAHSTKVLFLLALLGALGQVALAQTPAKSPKRGLAYGHNSVADMQAWAPGLSWWYNWTSIPDAGTENAYPGLGLDYAPMQWNSQLNGTTVTAAALAARIPAGAKYLLGFNEPNFTNQGNLTPSRAAALWPILEDVARQKNLKLVSPAMNYCGSCVSENGVTYNSPVKWLDAFFAAYPTAQVDYIAVHTYVCEERYLRDKIAELKKYNRPIWLTEFACGALPDSVTTLAVQQKYLLDAVNYLEKEPAIFRYSWFSGRNSEIPNINLLAPTSGQLTTLGQQYVTAPAGWEAGKLVPVSATATSQEKPETAAPYAIDADINTRWSSAFADPQAITLDYGVSKRFSRVLLTWNNSYAKDYTVDVSPDGAVWTNLITILNSDGGVDNLTGLNGQGRYLRIRGTRRSTTFGYSLWEIEAFGGATNAAPTVSLTAPTTGATYAAPASITLTASAADADGTVAKVEFYSGATLLATDTTSPYTYSWTGVAAGAYSLTATATDNAGAVSTSAAVTVTVTGPPVNLALGKRPVALSTQGTLRAANAVDGSLSTRWGSAFSDDQWIYVDLGATYRVNEVKITWQSSTSCGKDYTVEIAPDSMSWAPIKTVAGNTALTNDWTGLSGTGRFLRMHGTKRAASYGYSIYELEVYGAVASGARTVVAPAAPTPAKLVSPLLIFPNPVTARLTVAGITAFPATVGVYDTKGALVRALQVAQADEAANLDFSALKAGLYLLRASSASTVQTLRFVKQ